MPELPEIRRLAGQMNEALPGRTIVKFTCVNEKCLLGAASEYDRALRGRAVSRADSRGKWIFVHLDDGSRVALNLGMGGHAIYHRAEEPPRESTRIRLFFGDGTHLSVGFWWFGYFHHIAPGAPHPMTDELGPEPLDERFTPDTLRNILSGRGAVKTILLDQRRIAGIGNFYIHDLLWRAGVHPLTPARALDAGDVERLCRAMKEYLTEACRLGGASYERDLYDRPGGYGAPQTGYREGEPCSRCGTTIMKIKTGATRSFVCPACQPLKAKE